MIKLDITGSVSLDLRGRQSVRTTFKLSEKCIDALSILAGQMGIKQKSLFDHLVDDPQTLEEIAREYDKRPGRPKRRVAKTYVISRRSLENLDYISSRYNAPRDILVEFSIEKILPLIEQEKEKHAKRKKIVTALTEQMAENFKLLEQAEKELGEDDPLVLEMLAMLRGSNAGFKRIMTFLEKSSRIEDF